MTVTDKNYKETRVGLRLFFSAEIARYINNAGSMENLSLLLGKSRTYVRTAFSRDMTTERLESLYEECKRGIK